MTNFDLGESADDADEPDETDTTTERDSAEQSDRDDDQETDPREEPAFSFSDDLRESWYVRDEVLDDFEDAVDFETKPVLREHGVRNETGREIQDAAIQVAKNNPEELARIILDERGVDADED